MNSKRRKDFLKRIGREARRSRSRSSSRQRHKANKKKAEEQLSKISHVVKIREEKSKVRSERQKRLEQESESEQGELLPRRSSNTDTKARRTIHSRSRCDNNMYGKILTHESENERDKQGHAHGHHNHRHHINGRSDTQRQFRHQL